MVASLMTERVRSDIGVLARGGLDVGTFLAEAELSLQRAVPHCGACFALIDPSTQLLTSTFKFGDLKGRDDHDGEWAMIEYGETEQTTFTELARSPVGSAGSHDVTGGDVVSSRRMREYMMPHFDYADELRSVARFQGMVWGAAALFRGSDDRPFTRVEVDFVESLSAVMAHGLRSGLLAQLATVAVDTSASGPAVVMVDATNRIRQVSPGARLRLDQMSSVPHVAAPSGALAALVARARQVAAGRTDALPRLRVRVATGEWLVLHAAPMSGPDGVSGDVAITIEQAGPPEIVPLLVAAFELTERERDVTGLVLQGLDTKQIAAELHMSAYTVQDHLKAIFEKADVRSRRELMTRVFVDQYSQRMQWDTAPAGSMGSP